MIRYLIKKLRECTEYSGLEIQDKDCQILYNDEVLPLDTPLGDQERLHPEIAARGEHIKFHYRLTTEILDREVVEKDRFQALQLAPHPPIWVPEHLVYKCMNPTCGTEFGFFARPQHCRYCGKCFCQKCCANQAAIPRFGYLKPVQVCAICYLLLLSMN